MKKIFTLFSLLCFSISLFSQNVLPNPGFENWTVVGTRMDPNNWNTLNPNTAIVGVLTCLKATGADVHSGSAALKLITKSVLGQNANGLASTGTIAISPPGVSGGVAYTGRPDSIVGWYKYTSVSNDNGFVEFQLLGASATPDTIGYVRFLTPGSNVSTYTRFAAAIVYRSASPVANSIWIMSSSAGFTAQVNSTLFLDDLELVTNPPSGIPALKTELLRFSPNPVDRDLWVDNAATKVYFSLYDSFGKLVVQSNLEHGTTKLDFSWIASGLYFYTFLNEEKNKSQEGKIIIAH